ncbi:hypothetical protein PIB30_096804 [Stylosanthes scabra]|uniref:Uncharacterized protein n=1 Tax=Stylosanthes scabra TaxID=79078 RepID=A0ABU6ZUW5_9FABA|nr:hypothetical protein [Stylosanthes scabra]
MDAKVTGSSPSFKIRRGSAESTQKGGTGRFGVAATFTRREPCLDSFRVIVGLQENNRRTQRYYFDDKPFIHPLYSLWFDSDRLYELPNESFSTLRRRESSKGKDPSPQRSSSSRRASPTLQYSSLSFVIQLESPSSPSKIVPPTQGQEGGRLLKSWELVPPSEGWMCEGDEVGDKEAIEGIPARVDDVKEIEVEGKDEEEEEEEDDPKTNDPSLLMVIVSRAMIFPAFGRLQLVQVSRVPHEL